MPITNTVKPNARVIQAIERARTNDAKGVMSVKDAQAIAQTATKELFELRKGPVLDAALADVLAMGIEQGKRIANGDDRNALLLDIAVHALENGDLRTAKSIAGLL